ncbi:MAG: FxsA family protein [bacterium]
MFARLFLFFTIVPLIELLVLIPLGQQIGLWPTIAIVVLTAAVGAVLGKRQGLQAWNRIRTDLATGKMPGDSLLDGLAVLLACTLLITPGVLTDVTGLLLLTPFARKPLKAWAKRQFTNMLQNPNVTVIDVARISVRREQQNRRRDRRSSDDLDASNTCSPWRTFV